MEYQKIANLIDDALNQPSKFKIKIWVETNDESRRTYNVNSQIKFKITMLKSSLCDYSDAYILVKGTITVNNTAAADVDANNTNKKVIFKNCAPFTNCISEINNRQVDNAKDGAYVVNLDGYSDIRNHWIALYVNNKTVTYFDSIGVEHIPKEIRKFVNNKNIIANNFRMQAYDSVMCGYFCIRFIDFMFKGTSPFSPNNFEKNDDIILNYFRANL